MTRITRIGGRVIGALRGLYSSPKELETQLDDPGRARNKQGSKIRRIRKVLHGRGRHQISIVEDVVEGCADLAARGIREAHAASEGHVDVPDAGPDDHVAAAVAEGSRFRDTKCRR